MSAPRTIMLEDATDWDGFRTSARLLVMQDVSPEDVVWHTPDSLAADVFAAPAETIAPSTAPVATTAFTVPREFLSMCTRITLHRDPGRFDLMYRLLWRMRRTPGLAHDSLDPDMLRANLLARSIRRDMHKMKAFVRFRPVHDQADDPLHVAWFEPEHRIVAATAPFFARRFAQMRWAIMTPDVCVQWDGRQLTYGPGAQRSDAPGPDAGESLWLTYYANIFNPARLKLAMMRKEMPRKYWHNLPEAALIGELSAQAIVRSGQMVEAEATQPARRIVPLVQPDRHRAGSLSENASLDELAQAAQSCRECPIGEHATQAVWGQGPSDARLMIVGEQPGDEEDLRGQPFIGPAGRLFDRALTHLGWERSTLYVTNAVKHFKFELRGQRRIHKTAAQQEAAICADRWLSREIENVRPNGIIALGATAARALVGRSVPVMTARGQWMPGVAGVPVLVTLHPAALLRMEPAERQAAFDRWCSDLSQAAELAKRQ